jgi:hypothetical protein
MDPVTIVLVVAVFATATLSPVAGFGRRPARRPQMTEDLASTRSIE